MHCENPRYKQHLRRFLTNYPTADKNGEFAIITVNSADWVIDLEHPEKNTVKCCQMCSIQEDIKRVTSPGWTGQPANEFVRLSGRVCYKGEPIRFTGWRYVCLSCRKQLSINRERSVILI